MNNQVPKHSFLFLLVSFISMFLIYPFFSEYIISATIFKVFFTLILVSSLYILSNYRFTFILGAFFCFSALAFEWTSYFYPIFFVRVVGDLFYLFFLVILIKSICMFIFSKDKVTLDIVYGAACLYFIIGLFFATCYSLIELYIPGSFLGNFGNPVIREGFYSIRTMSETLIYFSFVTLTTLGYGDVTPASTPSQFLAILEAIVGQLFLAIAIGRSVGMYLSQKNQ